VHITEASLQVGNVVIHSPNQQVLMQQLLGQKGKGPGQKTLQAAGAEAKPGKGSKRSPGELLQTALHWLPDKVQSKGVGYGNKLCLATDSN
jgi:hypothetical protein